MNVGVSITGEALQELLKAKRVYVCRLDALSVGGEVMVSYFDTKSRDRMNLSLPDVIKKILSPKSKILAIEFFDRLSPSFGIDIYYTIPDPPEIKLPNREMVHEATPEEAGP